MKIAQLTIWQDPISKSDAFIPEQGFKRKSRIFHLMDSLFQNDFDFKCHFVNFWLIGLKMSKFSDVIKNGMISEIAVTFGPCTDQVCIFKKLKNASACLHLWSPSNENGNFSLTQ